MVHCRTTDTTDILIEPHALVHTNFLYYILPTRCHFSLVLVIANTFLFQSFTTGLVIYGIFCYDLFRNYVMILNKHILLVHTELAKCPVFIVVSHVSVAVCAYYRFLFHGKDQRTSALSEPTYMSLESICLTFQSWLRISLHGNKSFSACFR